MSVTALAMCLDKYTKEGAIMKNFLVALLVLCLGFTVVGCGGKPSNMDQKTYDLGKEAVQVANDYLNNKTSQNDAYKKLDSLYKQLDSYIPTNSTSHSYVKGYVLLLRGEFTLVMFSGEPVNRDTFTKNLGQLKEILNM